MVCGWFELFTQEEVELSSIKLSRNDGASGDDFQVKLLSTPIRIADFGVVVRRDEDEEDRKANPSSSGGGAGGAAGKPAGPSKKELRKLKEEKKKADMLLRKEKERRARAKAIKMSAVQTYLASDQKRSKEVSIDLFSLHTPDGSSELLLDQALRFTPGMFHVFSCLASSLPPPSLPSLSPPPPPPPHD